MPVEQRWVSHERRAPLCVCPSCVHTGLPVTCPMAAWRLERVLCLAAPRCPLLTGPAGPRPVPSRPPWPCLLGSGLFHGSQEVVTQGRPRVGPGKAEDRAQGVCCTPLRPPQPQLHTSQPENQRRLPGQPVLLAAERQPDNPQVLALLLALWVALASRLTILSLTASW